jgi:large subunit ribosomal protein L9
MEVILLEKITNLGNLGDKVAVKSGYGRNFLIPKGKAVMATTKKIAEFELRRSELEKAASEKMLVAQQKAATLAKLEIIIAHKAGEEGRLFGSVGTHTIADAIIAAGEQIEKQDVRLPHGTIRHIGEYSVDIHLHTDVTASVIVKVVPEV